MKDEDIGAGTIRRGNLVYFAVVPGRLEFAVRLRRFLLAERPGVIAVELPRVLEREYLKAIARMPKMSVIVIPPEDDDDDHATYIPVEPGDPFVEAVRTAVEIGAGLVFLEPPTMERPHIGDSYPEPYSIEMIGLERYVEAYRVHPAARSDELTQHAAGIAWKLQGTDPLASVCVVVSLNMLDALLDAMEMPQDEPGGPRTRLFHTAELFNLHPDCLAEVTSEAPFYQERYEGIRETAEMSGIPRPQWQLELLREAEKEYGIQTGEGVQSWQRIALAKFTRNLALLDTRLLPGVYDLALGARSIVDDNYAYEVWQVANRFSVQPAADAELETLNISGDAVWVRTRKLRIRRRLPRMKQRWKPRGLKMRRKEQFEGEWARETTGNSICSYPPEDLLIEDYGRFLKRYSKTVVSEERARVEPFTTSMLDGIDFRESVRNWHKGKLFVREQGKFSGEIGALVLIFDEDGANRYQYLSTWLGEHQNESDMAFYSTFPFDHLVGPGIGRAEYGGLLMTLPPRRMFDVWRDPDYEAAETKPERLLMAGLDYSVERHVLYIAAKPPRSVFRHMAARMNRKIIYIPLGQLSPAKLKKIRVVHVLDSYERRAEAKQYIW
jgi:hypothetical protein